MALKAMSLALLPKLVPAVESSMRTTGVQPHAQQQALWASPSLESTADEPQAATERSISSGTMISNDNKARAAASHFIAPLPLAGHQLIPSRGRGLGSIKQQSLGTSMMEEESRKKRASTLALISGLAAIWWLQNSNSPKHRHQAMSWKFLLQVRGASVRKSRQKQETQETRDLARRTLREVYGQVAGNPAAEAQFCLRNVYKRVAEEELINEVVSRQRLPMTPHELLERINVQRREQRSIADELQRRGFHTVEELLTGDTEVLFQQMRLHCGTKAALSSALQLLRQSQFAWHHHLPRTAVATASTMSTISQGSLPLSAFVPSSFASMMLQPRRVEGRGVLPSARLTLASRHSCAARKLQVGDRLHSYNIAKSSVTATAVKAVIPASNLPWWSCELLDMQPKIAEIEALHTMDGQRLRTRVCEDQLLWAVGSELESEVAGWASVGVSGERLAVAGRDARKLAVGDMLVQRDGTGAVVVKITSGILLSAADWPLLQLDLGGTHGTMFLDGFLCHSGKCL